MYFLQIVLLCLFSYLIGSIPFAYLVGKLLKNIDIRQYGSGNIGSTNTLRVVGKKGAALVFLADFGKGFLAAYLGLQLGGPTIGIVTGLIAVLGHIFPVWFKFKGGKGAAAGIGAVAAIFPMMALILVSIWILTLLVTGYVSLSTVLAAAVGEIYIFIADFDWLSIAILSPVILIVIIRHIGNLKRICKGQEYKFFRKNSSQAEK
ncbi:MAG: glycerol-3-phosphate 1-O-acyltransferase PlsY, partial [Clostridiales bacterium]